MSRAIASLVGCGLVLSLTACGGGREYAVPQEACGVALNEKTLDPFLVDGKEFKVVGDPLTESNGKNSWSCSISVDDGLVVDFRVDSVDKIYDPMDESESFRFTHRAKMEDLPFSGLGALGDRTAMVSTNCAGPKADYLVTEIRLSTKAGGDDTERRKHIEAFTVDFVPKVKKVLGCTA
ncbi:hypothetical protein [Streptomyces vilmorinianum]|uniref:hypothetical protein n=1 Tax=Streptomyces vilmorinianum TaxID=3051092 RepID=UPI0010FBB6B9|nr:hypothetical protein [Streptomyces vilmorinianum]